MHLTEAFSVPHYSRTQWLIYLNGLSRQAMSGKQEKFEAPAATLKNVFARQRWELFHRSIAHAKQSNNEASVEPESASTDGDCEAPILSIVR